MAADPWHQWASFVALFNPASNLSGRGASSQTPPGFAPFVDAERFAAAARAFYQNSQASRAAASQTFTDFLRDQFASALRTPGAQPGVDAPALGAGREHQERWQRAADAWARLDEAQRRLQRLWSDTLTHAAGVFVSRIGTPTAPITMEAAHRLYDTWIDCAEEAYARTAQGEPFCRALADAVNASSEWRREFAACLEVWAKWLDWPTRSEINTLTQRLRSLEKQLREIGRERKPRRRTRTKGKR